MSKHTPGPWMWDADPIKGDPLNSVRYRVVALGKTVTQCYYSSSDEAAQHDARLIAAAPKLLEALKKIDAICERAKANDIGWFAGVQSCARAAIAKAEGKE